jgi:methyltransferase
MLSQLARIASIQMVDEIIIVKDNSFQHRNKEFASLSSLTKILQYLETPQYLRKAFFPISQDLKYVGLMNPIESSHHLKADEYCQYREGVVMNRPVKEGAGSWVEIGLLKVFSSNTATQAQR